MTNKNPFSDAFNAWTSSYPSASNFDWDKMISIGRENAKAFSDAAKKATEGAQALGRRQAEIWQKNADNASKFFNEFASSAAKNPEAGLTKQAEFAKSAFEAGVSDSKELLEIAAKSGNEASEIINKRVSEALSEATNENKKKASSGNKNNAA